MCKVREVLRLHHFAGLSGQAIARSLKVAPVTVRTYIRRAEEQGLGWPLPDSLDDAELDRRLFPAPEPSCIARPLLDWSKGFTASFAARECRSRLCGKSTKQSPGAAIQSILCAVPDMGVDGRRGDAPGAPRGRGDPPSADLRRGAGSVELHVCRGDVNAGRARLDRLARTGVRVLRWLYRTPHPR